jgi:predicted Zn-dependent protease
MKMRTFFLLSIGCLWVFSSCSPTVDTSDDLPISARSDLSKSLDYLTKIIDHDPDNEEVRFQRAKIYLQLIAPLKAKDDILVALSEQPNNVDYLLLKAKIDKQLGQMEDVLAAIDKIQSLVVPIQSVDYLLFATEMNLEVGNFDKAGSFLRQATEYAPEYAPVLSQRARYYAYSHDTLKALAFYKLALAQDSGLDETKIGLAELYLKKHMVDSSIMYLSTARPQRNIPYYSLVAKTLLLTNQGDSASKYLYSILRLSPYDASANYEMAMYYMGKGDVASSLNFLDRIPENDRFKFKDYYYRYAVANEFIGNMEVAKESYKKQYMVDSTYLNRNRKQKKARVVIPKPEIQVVDTATKL